MQCSSGFGVRQGARIARALLVLFVVDLSTAGLAADESAATTSGDSKILNTAKESGGSERARYLRVFLVETAATSDRGVLERARRRVLAAAKTLAPSSRDPVIVIAYAKSVVGAGRFTAHAALDEFLGRLAIGGTCEPGSAFLRAVEEVGRERDAEALSIELISSGEFLGTERLRDGLRSIERLARTRSARGQLTILVLDQARAASGALARVLEARGHVTIADSSTYAVVRIPIAPRGLSGSVTWAGSCDEPSLALSIVPAFDVTPPEPANRALGGVLAASVSFAGFSSPAQRFELHTDKPQIDVEVPVAERTGPLGGMISPELRFDPPAVRFADDHLLIPEIEPSVVRSSLPVPDRLLGASVSGRVEVTGARWSDPVAGVVRVVGTIAVDASAVGCPWTDPIDLTFAGRDGFKLDQGSVIATLAAPGVVRSPFSGTMVVDHATVHDGLRVALRTIEPNSGDGDRGFRLELGSFKWDAQVDVPPPARVRVVPTNVQVEVPELVDLRTGLARFTLRGRFEVEGEADGIVPAIELRPPAGIDAFESSISRDSRGMPRGFEAKGVAILSAAPEASRARIAVEALPSGRFVEVETQSVEVSVPGWKPVKLGFVVERIERVSSPLAFFDEPAFAILGSVRALEAVSSSIARDLEARVTTRDAEGSSTIAHVDEPVRLFIRVADAPFAETLEKAVAINAEILGVPPERWTIEPVRATLSARPPLEALLWILSGFAAIGVIGVRLSRYLFGERVDEEQDLAGADEIATEVMVDAEIPEPALAGADVDLVVRQSVLGALVLLAFCGSGCTSVAETWNGVFAPEREKLDTGHVWQNAPPPLDASGTVWVDAVDLSGAGLPALEIRRHIESVVQDTGAEVVPEKSDSDHGLFIATRLLRSNVAAVERARITEEPGGLFGRHLAYELDAPLVRRIETEARRSEAKFVDSTAAESLPTFGVAEYFLIADVAVLRRAPPIQRVIDGSGNEREGVDFGAELDLEGSSSLELRLRTHDVSLHRIVVWCRRARLGRQEAAQALANELERAVTRLVAESVQGEVVATRN